MNPLLKHLGFGPTDRVVIFHADDYGMCHATLPAVEELLEIGLVSSTATMVPCAWFPAVAAYARAHPQADIGVHTTLTCEWNHIRWGAISTTDRSSGMLDADGYFHRTTPAAQLANPHAVSAELQTQVDRAMKAGIDITHIDSHMGVVFCEAFMPSYVSVGLRARVPAMCPRISPQSMIMGGRDASQMDAFRQLEQRVEASGMPLVDHIAGMPLDHHEDRVEVAKQLIATLPPGVTHFVMHPTIDTPEIRALAPDWRARVADYQAFSSPELRDIVRESGITVIGYRALRDAMRAVAQLA
jgi:chitin disaccharide deacetylase